MDVIKLFIDIYKKSFNAVDQESEENKNGDVVHTIKYAGWVTFYKNKKKCFGIGIRRNQKGETLIIQAHKNAKDKQMPVNFSSTGITFEHGSVLEITDIENKKVKGNCGAIEWMFASFDPKEVQISEPLVEFLFKYSTEGLKQRIEKDERFIAYETMKTHLNNFKNKRRDSNDFKEAVKVIQSFYNPKNIKVIDK